MCAKKGRLGGEDGEKKRSESRTFNFESTRIALKRYKEWPLSRLFLGGAEKSTALIASSLSLAFYSLFIFKLTLLLLLRSLGGPSFSFGSGCFTKVISSFNFLLYLYATGVRFFFCYTLVYASLRDIIFNGMKREISIKNPYFRFMY